MAMFTVEAATGTQFAQAERQRFAVPSKTYQKRECVNAWCKKAVWFKEGESPRCKTCSSNHRPKFCSICFDECTPVILNHQKEEPTPRLSQSGIATSFSVRDLQSHFEGIDGGSWRCKETFCQPCLSKYILSQLEDQRSAICPCPGLGCSASLAEPDVLRILPKEDRCKYFRVKFSQHKNRLYQVFRSIDEVNQWCKFNTQACPKCLVLVQRSEGCNHMHCQCGEDFCYACGASSKNNCRCASQSQPKSGLKLLRGNPRELEAALGPWRMRALQRVQRHRRQQRAAAALIQRYYLRARYNPGYQLCQDRLRAEHETLDMNTGGQSRPTQPFGDDTASTGDKGLFGDDDGSDDVFSQPACEAKTSTAKTSTPTSKGLFSDDDSSDDDLFCQPACKVQTAPPTSKGLFSDDDGSDDELFSRPVKTVPPTKGLLGGDDGGKKGLKGLFGDDDGSGDDLFSQPASKVKTAPSTSKGLFGDEVGSDDDLFPVAACKVRAVPPVFSEGLFGGEDGSGGDLFL